MKKGNFCLFVLLPVTFLFVACDDSGTSYPKYDSIIDPDVPECNASIVNKHIYVKTEGEYEERVCKYTGGGWPEYEWDYPDDDEITTNQGQKGDDCQCWGYYSISGKDGIGRVYYEISPGQFTGGDKYYVCGEDIKSFINQRPVIKSYMHNEDRCYGG